MSKQAVSKRIQVLEAAGLVTRSRDAQRRPVHLHAASLERLTSWIDRYRMEHERAYRRLDALLESGSGTPRDRSDIARTEGAIHTEKEQK